MWVTSQLPHLAIPESGYLQNIRMTTGGMRSTSQVRIPLEIARRESHVHFKRKVRIVTLSENTLWLFFRNVHTFHTSQQALPLMLTSTYHYLYWKRVFLVDWTRWGLGEETWPWLPYCFPWCPPFPINTVYIQECDDEEDTGRTILAYCILAMHEHTCLFGLTE